MPKEGTGIKMRLIEGNRVMTIFAKVTKIFRSPAALVAAANAQDLAYNVGVGKPEQHTPFTLAQVEAVATNTPGLVATDSAANAIARIVSAGRGENNGNGIVTAEGYIEALRFLATAPEALSNGTLSKDDWRLYTAYQFANATWRISNLWRSVCASFSAIAKKLEKIPDAFARLSGEANVQFNELPDPQIDKDLVQLVTGAKYLLTTISTPNQ